MLITSMSRKRKLTDNEEDCGIKKKKIFLKKHTPRYTLYNFSLVKTLSYLTTTVDSIMCNDFRHYVYDSIKADDCVQKIAESSSSMYKHHIGNYALKELMQLLKQKMLKHLWGDAAMILEGYAWYNWNDTQVCGGDSGANRHPEILQRAGREIFFNHPYSHSNQVLFESHLRSLRLCKGFLDQSHVSVEDGLYHFSRLDFEAAEQKLKQFDIPDKRYCRKEQFRQTSLGWSTLVDAYIGLSHYCLWRQNIELEVSSTKFADIANKAIDRFQSLSKAKGTWDIFVLKFFEILLFYSKLDILQNDITQYSNHHANNPNAHKYLYLFLKHHVTESTASIEKLKVMTLKRLQKVSGADVLILDLHTLTFNKVVASINKSKKLESSLKTMEYLYESFESLMTLLDHACAMHLTAAWCRLQKSLVTIKKLLENNCYVTLINRMWLSTKRNTWWPYFQFSMKSLSAIDDELVKAKKYAASVFLRNNSEIFLS